MTDVEARAILDRIEQLEAECERLRAGLGSIEWRSRVVMDECDGTHSPSLGSLEKLADAVKSARALVGEG